MRCDDKKTGTLSATIIQKNGELGHQENFDFETVCEAKKAKLHGYLSEENVQFMFNRSDGKIGKVTSEYGQDIQRDQNGFYMVLKIVDIPPFIVNDRI